MCFIEGCGREPVARGVCPMHYKRLRKSGLLQTPTLEERFWPKVNKVGPNGCWVWKNSTNRDGYGQFKVNGKLELAHVVSWKLVHPDYKGELYVRELDHKCRNRACVNTDHLQVVTHKVNVLLGEGLCAINARKTHCKYGHEYTPENTLIVNQGRSRTCKKCKHNRYRKSKSNGPRIA